MKLLKLICGFIAFILGTLFAFCAVTGIGNFNQMTIWYEYISFIIALAALLFCCGFCNWIAFKIWEEALK